MDEVMLALLIALGIFSLVPLGLLHTGLSGRREWRKRLERERTRATGTVEGLVEHSRHRPRGISWTAWAPVVTFRADGVEYRLEATASTQRNEYAPGDVVDVLYDPDDPTRFHLENRDCDEKADGRMIRMALIWLACMCLAAAALLAVRPGQRQAAQHVLSRVTPTRASEQKGETSNAPGFYEIDARSDGTAMIRKYAGVDEALAIPLLLDGRIVSGIGMQAFSRCVTLQSVSVPGTVRDISAGAFAACMRLREVSLASGVASIGPQAFNLCAGLESVTLPASLTSIDDSAFPEDCAARFYVEAGSAAERYCAAKGFDVRVASK